MVETERTINTDTDTDTEELYKKDLHDPDNHDGVITQLEADILECEVRGGLRKHHYKQS